MNVSRKLFIGVVLFASSMAHADIDKNGGALNNQKSDSVPAEVVADAPPKENLTAAGAQIFFINAVIWSFDRFVANTDYARIDFDSVKNNLRKGFTYDDNDFLTNQFLHPYHGSLYFTAARANGLSFWKSVPCTMGGSLLWELFMETERPALNDIVTTTMGGVLLGETTYRLSSLFLDDSATGSERMWREIAAGIISPIRGLNRLFRGKTKIHGTPPERAAYRGSFYMGRNMVGSEYDLTKEISNFFLKLDFEYGEPFLTRLYRRPLDYFSFHFEVNVAKDDLIGYFFENGLLVGKNYNTRGKHLVGLFQYYDFISSRSYKISSNSIGGALISYFSITKYADVTLGAHTAPVILGASNSPYAREAGRDYNFGYGFREYYEVLAELGRIAEVNLGFWRYWLHTVNGAAGNENIEILKEEFIFPFANTLGVGGEYIYYFRQGTYEKYPSITKRTSTFKVFLRYKF